MKAAEKTATRKKVLIIDDDPEVLTYLEAMLEHRDMAVSTMRKAPASRFSIWGSPDIVFVDMMMPERDGIQVIDGFVQVDMKCALVLMSACPERILRGAENYARMSGLKVLGALRKPIYPERVKSLLDQLESESASFAGVDETEFFRLAAGGALVNHYEPVIDVSRARVDRLEVLPRLRHPKMGLIEPLGMWDTAEAISAANNLQILMLDQSIEDGAKFGEANLSIPISCQVTSGQMKQSEFTENVLTQCRKSGLLPSNLCMTVAETDVRQSLVEVLAVATRLGLRGVQLAIHDFDSSALGGGMLARLPAESLTLNESLAAATLKDGDARSRVIDIVEFANRNEIRMIVSVATAEHMGLLIDLGVTLFRGPLFTEPRAHQEMLFWMANASSRLEELGIRSQIR